MFSIYIKSANIWLKFKWRAVDKDNNEIAHGAFKVSNKFVTKEDAVKIVKNQFFAYMTNEIWNELSVLTGFAFLQYNGTIKDNPQFIEFVGSLDNKTLTKYPLPIIFGEDKSKYLSNKTTDRFVWIVTPNSVAGSNDEHFVDVKTGEVIGVWNPCPDCM